MDKLKWTSPFTSHRTSLGHLSHSSSRRAESADDGCRSPFEQETYQQPADHTAGIHGLSHLSRSTWTDAGPSSLASPSAAANPPLSTLSRVDSAQSTGSGGLETPSPVESMVWATAVALAWLEHSSANYFIEWELVAAKASMWLSEQDIPEGRDLASVKAAANQLFIILRHWDENLQLNMLCYNPNSVWGLSVQDCKYSNPNDTMLTEAMLFSDQQFVLWNLILRCSREQCVFSSVCVLFLQTYHRLFRETTVCASSYLAGAICCIWITMSNGANRVMPLICVWKRRMPVLNL